MVIYIVFLGALMYFIAIRPQKKEGREWLLDRIRRGGRYSGYDERLLWRVLNITDEDGIVEFGNNKNCCIPMKKSAIAEVEKAGEA